MTKTQKLICEIADRAKLENADPIQWVKDYFDGKEDKPVPRSRVVAILAAARDEQRKETRKIAA